MANKAALLLIGLYAFASTPASAASWLTHEVVGEWDGSFLDAEEFLNVVCGPTDLSGIQLVAVQTGHDQKFNFHLYCRADHARRLHYSVTLMKFPRFKIDDAVNSVVDRPAVRVGPLFFGPKTDSRDGFILVEAHQPH
jgi:hypothetical protein